MKILFYSPHPRLNLQDLSGYGTHMREMISAFQNLGHEVLPVINGGTAKNDNATKNISKKILKDLIPVYIWETVKDYSLIKKDKAFEKRLIDIIKDYKPDLIYERGNYLQLSGCIAAFKTNTRHYLELNAPYTEEKKYMEGNSFFISRANIFEKQQIQLSEKVIVVSSALKDYFIKKHNLPEDKFIVTPNSINPTVIRVNATEVSKLKEKYNLDKYLIIGFVGSIFPYHGVDILIKAFPKIILKLKSKLLIVGDGESVTQLKNISDKLNLADKIIFTGNVAHDSIYNYIEIMDICLMPQSNWYGSPVKIFEYGALGKPIIAPDNIPLRDVMENNEDGILIESSEEKIAEVILALAADEKRRKLFGKNFNEKVLTKYTWEITAKKILSSLE